MWENSPHILKQLDGIGSTFSSNLVSAKILSFETLESTNPRKIEAVNPKNDSYLIFRLLEGMHHSVLNLLHHLQRFLNSH